MSTPKWIEEELSEFQTAYTEGNRIILFEAIRACGQYGIPLPDWVRQELQRGLDRYRSAESWEFGEAFGIVRPKGKWQSAEREKRAKAWPVFCAVIEAEKRGKGRGQSLYAAIGEEFGISASTVHNYYTEVRDYLASFPTE